MTSIKNPTRKEIKKTYDYKDESGKLLYQVVRYEPKDFRQRRPDGKGGWIWNLNGVKLVPYRLPELLKTSMQYTIFIVEGEKDSDRLYEEGIPATNNPMGAGKWRPEFNKYFKGRLVAILCDRDQPGERHGLTVAKSLHGITAETRLIFLDPELPTHTDVTDLIEKHNWTNKDFLELIENTRPYKPKETGPRLITQNLNDVEPTAVTWLWFSRFAKLNC